MAGRRALLVLPWPSVLALPLPGCGWEPLYADPQSGPASADLRAIRGHPDPRPDRPAARDGVAQFAQPDRRADQGPLYLAHDAHRRALSDLGIQSQGTATLGRLDVYANYHPGRQPQRQHLADQFAARAELVRAQSQPVFDGRRRGRCPGSQRRRAEPGDRDAAHPVHGAPRRAEPRRRRAEPVARSPRRGSPRFCSAPTPAIRAVLLYGPDAGLVRERADAPRPHRLPGFERPVPRRRSDRRRARRRSGAACRRGGAAEPGRRAPGGAGARRRGRAGAAVRRLSRRHAGRGAGRGRGRRARRPDRRCGARSKARRGPRRSAAIPTRRATAPR